MQETEGGKKKGQKRYAFVPLFAFVFFRQTLTPALPGSV